MTGTYTYVHKYTYIPYLTNLKPVINEFPRERGTTAPPKFFPVFFKYGCIGRPDVLQRILYHARGERMRTLTEHEWNEIQRAILR